LCPACPRERAIQIVAKRSPSAGDVGHSYVADPLVSSSYLQMAKTVASSIDRWRVLDADSGTAGVAAALLG
jgi:hypothetical protein